MVVMVNEYIFAIRKDQKKVGGDHGRGGGRQAGGGGQQGCEGGQQEVVEGVQWFSFFNFTKLSYKE